MRDRSNTYSASTCVGVQERRQTDGRTDGWLRQLKAIQIGGENR